MSNVLFLFIVLIFSLRTYAKEYKIYKLEGVNTCLPTPLGEGSPVVNQKVFPNLKTCQVFISNSNLSPIKETYSAKKYEAHCTNQIKKLKYITNLYEYEIYDRKKMGMDTISYYLVKEFKRDKGKFKVLVRTRRFSCMHGKNIKRKLLSIR